MTLAWPWKHCAGVPVALMLPKKPLPALRLGEVLIQVDAAGANPADIKQRRGDYPDAGLQVPASLGLPLGRHRLRGRG